MGIKISDQVVKDLAPPASGNRVQYDSDVHGFGVRITAAGARAFVMNYRAAGRERRLTIGAWPAWSVAAARREAVELRRRIDRGEDPMGERAARLEAPTVGDLCDRYLDEHAVRKRAASARDDKGMIEGHVRPGLGAAKVADVAFADIDRLHRRITRGGHPIRANRVAALLSKMFALAVKWGMRPDNPVKGVERNAETKRRRYLSGPELAALMAALGERKDDAAVAARLLLLTGARSGEALGATWGQFDLARGTWTKPSSLTKQGREETVPLSAPAALLLAERRAKLDPPPAADAAVFPGRGKTGQRGSFKRAWATITARATVLLYAAGGDTEPAGRIVAALRGELGRDPTLAEVDAAAAAARVKLPAGLRDLHVHDLRHSYASFLVSAGLSLPTIGRLLGHSNVATTARYAHLADDPLREATERVGAIVGAAAPAAGAPGGDVVALPTKARRARR